MCLYSSSRNVGASRMTKSISSSQHPPTSISPCPQQSCCYMTRPLAASAAALLPCTSPTLSAFLLQLELLTFPWVHTQSRAYDFCCFLGFLAATLLLGAGVTAGRLAAAVLRGTVLVLLLVGGGHCRSPRDIAVQPWKVQQQVIVTVIVVIQETDTLVHARYLHKGGGLVLYLCQFSPNNSSSRQIFVGLLLPTTRRLRGVPYQAGRRLIKVTPPRVTLFGNHPRPAHI
jgi:hypothetical protein